MEIISVIVPIYNVEKYLNKCIDSLLIQTYKALEIILVDDGSPDNCGKICDEYAEKDNRIKVIHKENGGLSDARNAGIEISTGEYIFFVDSDDYIEENMIDCMYQKITEDCSDMVVCDMKYVYEDSGLLREQSHYSESSMVLSAYDFFKAIFFNHIEAAAKLYKSELFKEIRFPKGKVCEDLFVTPIIADKCNSISYIPKSMYCYRIHHQSIMRSSYNIKHLDGTEGFINLVKFASEKKWTGVSITAYERAVSTFTLGLRKLDRRNKENAVRLRQLREELRRLYIREISKEIPFNYKVKMTLLCLNTYFPYTPKLIINKIKRSRKRT